MLNASKTLMVLGGMVLFTQLSLAADGEAPYNSACAACHTPGVAGARKLGDKDAWASRISKEVGTLYSNAIDGYQGEAGFMPAKGGSALPDDEVKAAVDYMIEMSQ